MSATRGASTLEIRAPGVRLVNLDVARDDAQLRERDTSPAPNIGVMQRLPESLGHPRSADSASEKVERFSHLLGLHVLLPTALRGVVQDGQGIAPSRRFDIGIIAGREGHLSVGFSVGV
jgi:hypothetical protein